ncbi:hypothetical protein HZA40_02890 [Candidatus Peregrinibacteria bacterium]|nr:hypothetical protein [Candidatus Peregrinibacteria bacterium]
MKKSHEQIDNLEFQYGYLWQVEELFHDLFWQVCGVQELAEWENYFNETIGVRISSIRGFKKETNARNYINAMILKYHFHKFTDCKGKFQK